MGTKAVFAYSFFVAGKEMIDTRIVGMTSDGFPSTLLHLAKQSKLLAKKLRCLTVFQNAGHTDLGMSARQKVRDALCKQDEGLFQDDNKNAEWVSYSAVYNPKTDSITIYEGHFAYVLYTGHVKNCDF